MVLTYFRFRRKNHAAPPPMRATTRMAAPIIKAVSFFFGTGSRTTGWLGTGVVLLGFGVGSEEGSVVGGADGSVAGGAEGSVTGGVGGVGGVVVGEPLPNLGTVA